MSITLQNDNDKTSYCLGMDIGASFRKLPVTINPPLPASPTRFRGTPLRSRNRSSSL